MTGQHIPRHFTNRNVRWNSGDIVFISSREAAHRWRHMAKPVGTTALAMM
jgi:hypothetical protein